MKQVELTRKKDMLLGMTYGKATGRLKKAIMFSLVVETGKNICHRCGGKIEAVDELSVEHKTSWERAIDPVVMFFDLANIAFSHLRCNIGAAFQPKKKYATRRERKLDHDRRHQDRRVARKKEWRRERRAAGLPYT